MSSRTGLLHGLLLGTLLGACATLPQASLHQQLGGADGIARLVAATIVEVHGDPRISELFAETDDAYFRARLEEFICQIADGDCDYAGLPMPDAHSGMDISEREFNYFVEDFERAMNTSRLPLAVQNRLLARLARLRDEIIGQ